MWETKGHSSGKNMQARWMALACHRSELALVLSNSCILRLESLPLGVEHS